MLLDSAMKTAPSGQSQLLYDQKAVVALGAKFQSKTPS